MQIFMPGATSLAASKAYLTQVLYTIIMTNKALKDILVAFVQKGISETFDKLVIML